MTLCLSVVLIRSLVHVLTAKLDAQVTIVSSQITANCTDFINNEQITMKGFNIAFQSLTGGGGDNDDLGSQGTKRLRWLVCSTDYAWDQPVYIPEDFWQSLFPVHNLLSHSIKPCKWFCGSVFAGKSERSSYFTRRFFSDYSVKISCRRVANTRGKLFRCSKDPNQCN